jgi:hypothetical protein
MPYHIQFGKLGKIRGIPGQGRVKLSPFHVCLG